MSKKIKLRYDDHKFGTQKCMVHLEKAKNGKLNLIKIGPNIFLDPDENGIYLVADDNDNIYGAVYINGTEDFYTYNVSSDYIDVAGLFKNTIMPHLYETRGFNEMQCFEGSMPASILQEIGFKGLFWFKRHKLWFWKWKQDALQLHSN